MRLIRLSVLMGPATATFRHASTKIWKISTFPRADRNGELRLIAMSDQWTVKCENDVVSEKRALCQHEAHVVKYFQISTRTLSLDVARTAIRSFQKSDMLLRSGLSVVTVRFVAWNMNVTQIIEVEVRWRTHTRKYYLFHPRILQSVCMYVWVFVCVRVYVRRVARCKWEW